MNRAAALFAPCVTLKAFALPLKTCPVGPPGTLTVSGIFVPVPLYRVVVFVPLFETHHGVVGPAEMPQALTSDASLASVTSVLTVQTLGPAAAARPAASR